MDITDTLDDLLEQDFSEGLLALLPLPHEVEQVTASAQLHHEHDMTLRLERLVELDDRDMPETEQNAHLVHDLRTLLVIGQVFLVDRFDGNQLPRQLMHAQVDLTEGTAAKHLARSVELCGCLWRLTCLVERFLKYLRNLHHFDDPRRDVTALAAWALLAPEDAALIVLVLANIARNRFCRKLASAQGLLSDVDGEAPVFVATLSA